MSSAGTKPTRARRARGILASCQLPWDERGHLLSVAFAEEISFLARAGFTELYVFGTAGEGYAVDTSTFRQVVELFLELTTSKALTPMVGVIGMSTAAVVERIAIAHALGARRFQISLPPWLPLSEREIDRYFVAVCGTFPGCEFLHYNTRRTQRFLTGPQYRRVADLAPNLVATKNVAADLKQTAELMRCAPDLQHFFGENNYGDGALLGECSLLTTYGALAPQLTHDYFRAGVAGDAEGLRAAREQFMQMHQRLVTPLLARGLADGAYDKLWLRLGGLASMPLRMLSPYEGFSDEDCARIAQGWQA